MRPVATIRLDSNRNRDWPCAGQSGTTLVCDAQTRSTSLSDGGVVRQSWDDPRRALDAMTDGLTGQTRWVGFIGYEAACLFERLPEPSAADVPLPLFAFALIEPGLPPPLPVPGAVCSVPCGSTFAPTAYRQAVRRIIDYIAAGDVYQVNLSQRLRYATTAEPVHVYARLMQSSPCEFGALLDFGSFQILSSSPELFFRVEPLNDGTRRITSRPIKGTRVNAPGMRRSLLESEKDRAELAMIVDLVRNDLGRICETGSVVVSQPRVIEEHATVLHGVATIEGVLRKNVGFLEILQAIFPCGSVTGCPKIRAMQIIQELEPVPRGAYCGAIGYLAADGSMQFNVAIRTMTMLAGSVYVPVGGGIVADSTPESEYQETLVKARGMCHALGADLPGS
ncbi:MAG: anthranilate synthase component I family protein [Phycisphaerae bacterium]|nr:anthranilate synthase component I family protein [Phycisphaerae bacterium]MDW8263175.1 anthranilate synthase component I family protein [Phycisphaerales bacterium]